MVSYPGALGLILNVHHLGTVPLAFDSGLLIPEDAAHSNFSPSGPRSPAEDSVTALMLHGGVVVELLPTVL